MIGFLLFLLVLAVICLAMQRSTESQKRSIDLTDRENRASFAIDDEFRHAKRAMNDAAGQSWRNLAG